MVFINLFVCIVGVQTFVTRNNSQLSRVISGNDRLSSSNRRVYIVTNQKYAVLAARIAICSKWEQFSPR